MLDSSSSLILSGSTIIGLLEVAAFLGSSLVYVTLVIQTQTTARRQGRGGAGGGAKKENGPNESSSSSTELVSKTAVGIGKMTKEQVMELRKEYFSNRLSVSYSNTDPLMIMRVSVGLLFLFLLAAVYLFCCVCCCYCCYICKRKTNG